MFQMPIGIEATASEAVPMKDTKTGEGDSEVGELKEEQGSYAIPRSLLRAAYGAEYYQGDWDPDANRNAIRIPKVSPVQSTNYLPSFRPQQLPAVYIRRMAQMGVRTCRFRSVPEAMVP